MSAKAHQLPLFEVLEASLVLLCGVAVLVDSPYGKYLLAALCLREASYVLTICDFRLIWRRRLLGVCMGHMLGVAATGMVLVVLLSRSSAPGREPRLASLWLALMCVTALRFFATWLLSRPGPIKRLLILGTGQAAIELARELLARKRDGYEILGFIGDDPKLVGQRLVNPCVIGTLSELEHLVGRFRADGVVVAMDDRRGRLPLSPLLRLKLGNVAVEESAACYERITGKIVTHKLRPSRLIFADDVLWMHVYRRCRRILDLTLALVGMLFSLPVMIVVAVAIKLDSRGPLFYVQERVGLRNKLFKIIKFRSMRPDSEPNGPVWAFSTDPRVTRVGRLIRRLHLDELPQFVNVLRGEMSIVGPRPERPAFVSLLSDQIPYYSERHLIKPGLTGWAQICYPYGASIADAVEKLYLDLFYIKNQSPYLDAIILLQTARMILFGRWTAEHESTRTEAGRTLRFKQSG